MHILEIITPSGMGGAEAQLITISRGLLDAGDQVTVFCPSSRPIVPYLRDQGIQPITWRTFGKADLHTALRLAVIARRQGVDVIHTHLSTASLLGGIAARLSGKPCVATVHGLTDVRWYKLAHVVVAVSHAVRRHLLAGGLAPERVVVVHNGIRLDRFVPVPAENARRASGRDPATPIVGLFGRLAPEKGQEVALQAWPMVAEQVPAAKLLMVGQGRSMDRIRALVARLNVQDSVELLGYTPRPWELMCACDVVVQPSLREGLSLSAIEAMALERPVVASDVDGLSEVVEHGQTGVLVPSGDAHRLAEAIVTLLRDPELRRRMGAAGRRRAMEQFDSVQQVARLRQLLAATARVVIDEPGAVAPRSDEVPTGSGAATRATDSDGLS